MNEREVAALARSAIQAVQDYCDEHGCNTGEALRTHHLDHGMWVRCKAGKRPWTLELIVGAFAMRGQQLVVRQK